MAKQKPAAKKKTLESLLKAFRTGKTAAGKRVKKAAYPGMAARLHKAGLISAAEAEKHGAHAKPAKKAAKKAARKPKKGAKKAARKPAKKGAKKAAKKSARKPAKKAAHHAKKPAKKAAKKGAKKAKKGGKKASHKPPKHHGHTPMTLKVYNNVIKHIREHLFAIARHKGATTAQAHGFVKWVMGSVQTSLEQLSLAIAEHKTEVAAKHTAAVKARGEKMNAARQSKSETESARAMGLV